jgi:hypothetical protein
MELSLQKQENRLRSQIEPALVSKTKVNGQAYTQMVTLEFGRQM